MTTQKIANQLVELCKKGKWAQAQKELYAQDAISVEPFGWTPRLTKGLTNIKKKGEFWAKNTKVYGMEISKPTIAGNWFTMKMTVDSEMKGRPRAKSTEICMYEVKDGKIISEQFFS